jgi:hypothetical protein
MPKFLPNNTDMGRFFSCEPGFHLDRRLSLPCICAQKFDFCRPIKIADVPICKRNKLKKRSVFLFVSESFTPREKWTKIFISFYGLPFYFWGSAFFSNFLIF